MATIQSTVNQALLTAGGAATAHRLESEKAAKTAAAAEAKITQTKENILKEKLAANALDKEITSVTEKQREAKAVLNLAKRGKEIEPHIYDPVSGRAKGGDILGVGKKKKKSMIRYNIQMSRTAFEQLSNQREILLQQREMKKSAIEKLEAQLGGK